MTKEQQFFIQIISDHLNGRATEVPGVIDWSVISRLSNMHDVEGIVFSQCKEHIPADQFHRFEAACGAALFLYANRKREMDRIAEAFRKARISFCTVKGFAISRYYPLPALRTMGDCDIVIKNENIADAVEVMKRLEYTLEADVDNQYCFNKKGLTIEIHDLLVKNFEMADDVQASFFNLDPFQYVSGEELDESFHFLFILMHLRKHIVSSGAGIRYFADLAVIISGCDHLRWDWIETKLNEIGLLRFAKFCFYLVSTWFEVKTPFGLEEVDSGFYETVTERILEGGVFGFDNNENKGNNIRNRIINSKNPKWITKIQIIIETIFPSYDNMRWYPGCGYLNGRPFLLPLAWVHRVFSIFIRKRLKNAMEKVGSPVLSNKALYSREDFLKKMGL